MKQFKVSATGGTFDVLHKGHMIMLATSFEKSDSVILGTSTVGSQIELVKSD